MSSYTLDEAKVTSLVVQGKNQQKGFIPNVGVKITIIGFSGHYFYHYKAGNWSKTSKPLVENMTGPTGHTIYENDGVTPKKHPAKRVSLGSDAKLTRERPDLAAFLIDARDTAEAEKAAS